ncbi:Polynucleotidyl transferase- ribonuclease H-like superfamily protein [Striga hermonthica]|uniref:Polynucleotidyl transferase- ribonuclease H-like superfamily protein n=1 Tax=Striga hermonthica TaxID=68872 RepID=A0A9N7MPI2_STRHE|nr:Polynucleotidyl transferase- ribonuclease H-like superfamily protein [Striga hermonthica]
MSALFVFNVRIGPMALVLSFAKLWAQYQKTSLNGRVYSQFLWLIVKGKLLTNVERRRQHLTDSSLCTLCGRAEESTLHCLRDCARATLVWQRLLPDSMPGFFSLPLPEWLSQNLQNGLHINVIGWKTTFGVTLWQLWRGRNEEIFSAVELNVDEKIQDVYSSVDGIKSSTSVERLLGGLGIGRDIHFIRWEPPEGEGSVDRLHLHVEVRLPKTLLKGSIL